MRFRLDTVTRSIIRAELELYNLDADEADWNLAITLIGPFERFVMSGTVSAPALPGPSALEIHQVEEPSPHAHGDQLGALTTTPESTPLELVRTDGGVHIRGRTTLWWNAISDDSTEQRELELELELEAALDVV